MGDREEIGNKLKIEKQILGNKIQKGIQEEKIPV